MCVFISDTNDKFVEIMKIHVWINIIDIFYSSSMTQQLSGKYFQILTETYLHYFQAKQKYCWNTEYVC